MRHCKSPSRCKCKIRQAGFRTFKRKCDASPHRYSTKSWLLNRLPSEGKGNLSNKLRRVESLTMQDRLHCASKVLFSHGIAPASGELFDRLQKLHPALKE